MVKWTYEDYFGKSDVWERSHRYVPPREYVVDTHVEAIKNLIIESLRDLFKNHQSYQYVPRTDGVPGPDLTKTKIVITDVYTYEAKFLPVITVRIGSSTTHHISFNQDVGSVDYLCNEDGTPTRDEYGRQIPIYYEYNGAWDSSVSLNIFTEDTISREELTTFTSIVAINILRDKWRYQGMFVKNVSVGGETEALFANDYIYSQPITLEVYSEWTRRIPVPTDILEGINYSIKTVGFNGQDSYNTLLVTPELEFNEAIFYNGASWQVKSKYRDLLTNRLDLAETIVLLNELVDKVNNSSTELIALPISHSLTSFDTINVNDFFLVLSHTDDSLREDGLQLANELTTFIGTLTDPGQISSLTSARDRLRNIERTLTGQTVEIN